VRKATEDLGNTINIQAWADWKRLRESLGRDYQHEFEQNGVKTYYQINEPGKSTSDVAMVGSIHESLNYENGLDVYVIGTGDADFTPVAESIRNQGKKVVVLALQGSLGNKLRQAADEARYLDDYISLPLPIPSQSAGPRESRRILAATLVVANILRTRRWQYVFLDRLPNWLQTDWMHEALGSGLLMLRSPSDTSCVMLNMDNPATQQMVYFEKWVQGQLHYYLSIRRFDYVDTALLAGRMQKDKRCQELNIGQTKGSVIALLEAAKEARQLEHKIIDHPKHQGVRIHTWAPLFDHPKPEQAPSKPSTGASPPKLASPEEMVHPATDSANQVSQEANTLSGSAERKTTAF
jgi:hypothetical protein